MWSALLPVVLLVSAGVVCGRAGWVRPSAIKDLSNLVFLLLTPALLFRTMAQVHVEALDFRPVMAYFAAAVVIFSATLALQGLTRRATVLALASTFSNTVMIGIALVSLLYGPAGLVTLLTLVSVHSVVLLTAATVLLELAVLREQAPGAAKRPVAATVLMAIRNAVWHPVPLPVIAGLLFAQTGWAIPETLDRPLALLAQAFSPLALVLVGVTLAFTPVGRYWRAALLLAGVKNLLYPLLVWLLCGLLGVQGVPMQVMVITAALPIGANVFLFSQRYDVAQGLVTASVAVSTTAALLSLPLVLLLLA